MRRRALNVESIIRAPVVRHRARAAGERGRPGGAAHLVPGGHRAHHPGRHVARWSSRARWTRSTWASCSEGMPARIKVGAHARRGGGRARSTRSRPSPRRRRAPRCSTSRSSSCRAPGVVLRAGYSANADIVVREKTDVLLAARAAGDVRGRQGHGRGARPAGEGEPVKKEIKVGLSDGINVEVADGPEGEGPGRRAAAEEDRVERAPGRHDLPLLPPPDAAGRPPPEDADAPDPVRHHLGHGVGRAAGLLRRGAGEAHQEEPARPRREHRDRLARAHRRSPSRAWARAAASASARRTSRPCAARSRRPPSPASTSATRARFRRERARAHPRHVGHQPRLRGDAQHHPRRGRPLHQRPGRGPPPARGLPRRQAQAGPLRRARTPWARR